jgi:hypothetical protein
LLATSDGGGLLSAAKVVPAAAIGTDNDLACEGRSQALLQKGKGAGSAELKVIKMGMNMKHSHGALT